MDNLLSPHIQQQIQVNLKLKPFPYFVVDNFLKADFFKEINDDFQRIQDSLDYVCLDDPTLMRREGEEPGRILRIGMGNDGKSWEHLSKIHSRSKAWHQLFTMIYSREFFELLMKTFCNTDPYRERVGRKKLCYHHDFYKRSLVDKFLFLDCCTVCKIARYTNNVGFLPHQDHGEKIIALLYYLGNHDWLPDSKGGTQIWSNESVSHLASWSELSLTPLERSQLKLHEDVQFKPNRLFGFFKTPNSWHGALPMDLPPGVYRDVLQINVFRCRGQGMTFKAALAVKQGIRKVARIFR